MGIRSFAAEICSAPNTAKGMAKHKLLKATILSRPRAFAKSALAAHSAIRKIRMPALHIEAGVREIAKKTARGVVCMGYQAKNRVLYSVHVFPGSINRYKLYDEKPEGIPEVDLALKK